MLERERREREISIERASELIIVVVLTNVDISYHRSMAKHRERESEEIEGNILARIVSDCFKRWGNRDL